MRGLFLAPRASLTRMGETRGGAGGRQQPRPGQALLSPGGTLTWLAEPGYSGPEGCLLPHHPRSFLLLVSAADSWPGDVTCEPGTRSQIRLAPGTHL